VEKFDVASATRWGRPYDFHLRRWLPPEETAAICDVACGSGGLLHFFKARGYRNLTGVDISEEQVTLARQVVPAVSQGEARRFLADRPRSFALITGLDIVEHMRKDEVVPFLESCWEALQPCGRLILQTPNADSPWASAIRYGDFTHEICFNPHSLGWLMSLCGYREIQSREGGPVANGVVSFGRWITWQAIRMALKVWNLAETGSVGSGVHTRVFLISGIKGASN